MELSFLPKAESGWRGRGAPPREVPDTILQMLRHTEKTGEVGVIDTTGDTEEEIKDAISALRSGARQMGRRALTQRDKAKNVIRFQLAPRSTP